MYMYKLIYKYNNINKIRYELIYHLNINKYI